MPHLVKPNWLGTLKLTMAENKEPKILEAVTVTRNSKMHSSRLPLVLKIGGFRGDGCAAMRYSLQETDVPHRFLIPFASRTPPPYSAHLCIGVAYSVSCSITTA